MENQGVGAHSEPFFDLLQPTTPVIHSSAPPSGANYTPNGPRRSESSTSGEFDFKNDDVLPSYDFQPLRGSGGSGRFEDVQVSAAAKSRQASPPPSSYEQICRPRDPPITYEKYESARPRQEHDKEAYDSATVAAVERTMKKYADNLLRVLEGMSGRLSQLEATTQRLEQSFEKSKGASAGSFGEVDGKLRMLENMVREVQRSVQIVRDKQEISEAQLQLKLQQDTKPESAPAKPITVSEIPSQPTAPPPAPVVPHHSVAQAQPQPIQAASQHHLDPNLHQQQVQPTVSQMSMPQQVQPTVPQMPIPQPQAPPAPQPSGFYSSSPQMVHPSHQQHQHQHQQQPGGPPPQLHAPPSIHQPEAPPYPPPPQPPVPSSQQQGPVLPPPSGPASYAMEAPVPPPPYMSQSYAPAPPTRPPHIAHQHVPPPPPQLYEPGRTSSGQLALPPPPYAQYEPPPPAPGGSYGVGGYRVPQAAPAVGGGSGGGGYPHLPTAQPVHSSRPASRTSSVDDVIDKVAAMGFPREQVRSTVQRLTENGQPVDMNVVLDKLMNGGGGADLPPKSGWFGR